VTHVPGATTSEPASPETLAGADRPGPPPSGEGGERPERGPAIWQVVLLVLALCGLAAVIGWRLGSDEPDRPGASSVDVGFFRDMTTHHQQAVTMALEYLKHGEDPFLLQVAGEIASYQSSEIGMMNEYLREWGQAGTGSDTAMDWMGPPLPRDEMPGLATREELEQLENARGAELDALFTELMIVHHAGGMHMAANAAGNAELASTRRWGVAMDDGQRGEISEMNRWRARHQLEQIVPPLAEFTPPADEDH
jgi:uncharacterized protein (DUF305 family)